MAEFDAEFETLAALEAQAGKPAVVTLLTRHRSNVAEAIAELSAMKAAIDFATIHMLSHRMRGACGSLGFHHLAALFEQMDAASQKTDAAAVAAMITTVEAYNARLTEAVHARYPGIAG